MTTVGILSDNHGDWPAHITESLVGVDAIIHAGDIGPYKLVLDMEAIAPTTAVLGNTDGDMPLDETAVATVGGKKFLVQHIVDPTGSRHRCVSGSNMSSRTSLYLGTRTSHSARLLAVSCSSIPAR